MDGVRPRQRAKWLMGGTRFNEEQVNSLAEGGSDPSREDFKDNTEVGGDRGDNEEEGKYQGSEHEPSANRTQDGAGIEQEIDESESNK